MKEEFLNPKMDWVFKLMFSKGKKGNKALISFLNAFLEDSYGKIKKADILNTELIRETPNGETYHLDFLIKTDTGLIIDLEMQQFWKANYPRRSQMYLLRLASRFLKLESKKDDPFYAVSISVFGCNVPKNAKLVKMSENSVIQYIYIELNELIGYTIKKSLEDYTLKDFWIRFLTTYEQDKKSGMLKKLCELAEGIRMAEETILKVTEEERRIARELSREKYQMLLEAERGDARREGLAEGRAEGFADGEYQAKLDMAKLMKTMNYSLDDIHKITGLAIQEIKEF
ncbi:Rpn family recombination-promoting nuclease/putative transposase [Treponema denticola]|uniref:Rpn family recombination-promoting nuclease/putative transposase n=1 Tax=Treponema denticola TaxID=158 RepID=A0A9Q9EWA4_TREDN|nr:Rpn family recombination-promoting nuclease/putative transposase [Treponema denticola]UTC91321.1 Rpn family recombination-promoting nuclease/putative transposase [Treponema denticola]UTC99325.1 Rpn family recombination-promoting nuclease/putative transposase [Treponema denticola]UTD04125.1 Rpn family recombination-promoting nuclease/putative transposase [Treponema denticola]